jgi:hypothetical protein
MHGGCEVTDGSTVCIVGNGASLRGRGLGKLIDSHVVIRVRNHENVEDLGARTDYWPPQKPGVPPSLAREPVKALETTFAGEFLAPFQELLGPPATGPEGLSVGFWAIMWASIVLRPERILLAGFDNLWAGSRANYEKFDGNRVPAPDCNYALEKSLLPRLEERYGVKIGSLLTP